MTDQANGVNGSDKTNGSDKAGLHAGGALNGATHDAVPAKVAPAPAPVRAFSERASEAAPPLDGYRSLSQGAASSGSNVKLQGTTRVVNAFIGYATNVLGRQADQLTEADVACLGGMLASLERLEQAPRSGRFAA